MPGIYSIVEAAQPHWTATTPAGGTAPVVLRHGDAPAVVDFGNLHAAEIRGSVFRDLDGNGQRDGGEAGLANWAVNLINPLTSGVIASTSTALDGSYVFTDLQPGDYLVAEVQVDGWAQTAPGGDYAVSLEKGQVVSERTFGNHLISPSSISGSVWNDADGSGTREEGESATPGWTVWLDLDRDGQWDPMEPVQVTGVGGTFTFGELGSGTYVVREELTDGWKPTNVAEGSKTVEAPAEFDLVGVDFGNQFLPRSNHQLVVDDGWFAGTENTGISGQAIAYESGGDPLTFTVVDQPMHGTLTLDVDTGDFTYMPLPDYSGVDSFTFTAGDGAVQSRAARVTLTMNPPAFITGWSSAATHGAAGEALLAIPDNGTFSEPRNTGIRRLVVGFSDIIDPASFTSSSVQIAGHDINGNDVDLSGITISTSTRDGDTEGVIDFGQALPDMARYLVRIQGVTDVAGNALTGDNDRTFTALSGDANGDGRVNSTDLSLVNANRINPIGATNTNQVRSDVFLDGRVNATDLSVAWARHGEDARYIPDPTIGVSGALVGQTLVVQQASTTPTGRTESAASESPESGELGSTSLPRAAQPLNLGPDLSLEVPAGQSLVLQQESIAAAPMARKAATLLEASSVRGAAKSIVTRDSGLAVGDPNAGGPSHTVVFQVVGPVTGWNVGTGLDAVVQGARVADEQLIQLDAGPDPVTEPLLGVDTPLVSVLDVIVQELLKV